ncbi:MAG: tyrosine-type recombinase/integrase [Xenococcaceae cyanobacterium]
MLELLRGEDLKFSNVVPLTLHPAAVYLSSLSKGSRRTMRGALDKIASLLTDGECDALSLDWSKLRYQHTAAVRAALIDQIAPASVNKTLSALRRVMKEAYRLDLIDERTYFKAVDLADVRLSGELRGRALKIGEIKALLASCISEATVGAIRDAAVITILRCGGLRREELTLLKVTDVDLETGEVSVRRGKGGKFRIVYLNNTAIRFAQEWLNVRGKKPGAFICPVNKGSSVIIRHFAADGDGIYKLIKQRAQKAGITHFSPHDFRRTFFSELLDEEDTITVQKMGGHSTPAMTAKYDRRERSRQRMAVEKLQF